MTTYEKPAILATYDAAELADEAAACVCSYPCPVQP